MTKKGKSHPQNGKGPIDVRNVGLRNVCVADSKISEVDGLRGRIVYRGYRIESLAQHSSFEETAFLLLNGYLPTKEELDLFDQSLKRERWIPRFLVEICRRLPHSIPPMDILQAAVAVLAGYDQEIQDESREANMRKAIRLIAKLSTVTAAWARLREGNEPVSPREDLSHAGNFLYMLSGNAPDRATARQFDICLILQADHQFNASTFTCRVVASTRAHMYASIASAVGALSGILHGGANLEVMRMLREIGALHNVDSFVKKKLDSGEKIMGIGHAVYKTYDPRARILKRMARDISSRARNPRWFRLAEQVEKAAGRELAARGKEGLHPNVDFFGSLIYNALGIPEDLSTPVFAMSRVSGWAAHVIEEKYADAQPKPLIYRPQARYTGPSPNLRGLPYVAITKRKPRS
jgi:citrate synthase